MANHWNHRVCVYTHKENGKEYRKLGVFEVYYGKDNEVIAVQQTPERSWFIDNCGDENTPESCAKAAQWELKMFLKAFRVPILDHAKLLQELNDA